MKSKDGGRLPVDGPDGNVSPGEGDAEIDPSCVPASESCNELDDNCNGKVDEVFNVQNDAENCGKCGTVNCAAIGPTGGSFESCGEMIVTVAQGALAAAAWPSLSRILPLLAGV